MSSSGSKDKSNPGGGSKKSISKAAKVPTLIENLKKTAAPPSLTSQACSSEEPQAKPYGSFEQVKNCIDILDKRADNIIAILTERVKAKKEQQGGDWKLDELHKMKEQLTLTRYVRSIVETEKLQLDVLISKISYLVTKGGFYLFMKKVERPSAEKDCPIAFFIEDPKKYAKVVNNVKKANDKGNVTQDEMAGKMVSDSVSLCVAAQKFYFAELSSLVYLMERIWMGPDRSGLEGSGFVAQYVHDEEKWRNIVWSSEEEKWIMSKQNP